MTGFTHPALQQLTDQQVRFAPPARRLEQADQARRLSRRDRAGQTLSVSVRLFPRHRLPSRRPRGLADRRRRSGRRFARDDPSAGRPVVTLEEVSKRLNVSTKTIRRWRKFGLEGRSHIESTASASWGSSSRWWKISWRRNTDRVERGGRFSQMTDAEREEVLRRAKRLSHVGGGTLTEVSRRIARRLGRSVEAIRYTIKNFDREHPDQALFPNLTGPFDAETKQIIYNSFRRGITVDTLRQTVFNARGRRCTASSTRCAPSACWSSPSITSPSLEFDNPALDAVILAPMPDAEAYEAKRRSMHAPKDVPPELASCYEYPLLDQGSGAAPVPQDELPQVQGGQAARPDAQGGGDEVEVDPTRVRIQTLKEIEDLQAEANAVKEMLINCQHAAGGEHRQEALGPGRQLLRADVGRQHVADAGRGEVRLLPRLQVQHLRQLGDHEELRPQHPGGQAPPRALRHRPRGVVRRGAGQPHRRARDAGDAGAGDAQRQPAAGVPGAARARDHPDAGRHGRERQEHHLGGDRPASSASPRSASASSTPGR